MQNNVTAVQHDDVNMYLRTCKTFPNIPWLYSSYATTLGSHVSSIQEENPNEQQNRLELKIFLPKKAGLQKQDMLRHRRCICDNKTFMSALMLLT